jgi:hypothetical protein
MIPEWERYWSLKADDADRLAQRMDRDGYPELGDEYREEAQEIRSRFLADAVIIDMPDDVEPAVAIPEDPGIDFEGLEELEKRYLDGDR